MAADFPKRVIHGGIGKWQQEKNHKSVLDFSASVNPYPPAFAWECDPVSLSRYPDDNYHTLKDTIAHTYHRDPEEICVSNGSIEIIRVFCQVVLKPGKKYFFETPTFGEYDLSARLAGASRVTDPAKADVGFVCNPNNPTGILRQKEGMDALLADTVAHNGLLFCDEAFIDLADPSQSISGVRNPNLFVLHSITKSFSVPGIRFGFGFGEPDLIEKIEIIRPPWSVNAYAEAFAMQALKHREDLAHSRKLIDQERAWLASGLSELGLEPLPSSVNYILVECHHDVKNLCERLTVAGILVRDCTSFGLPTCIRVAVMNREQNRILMEAMAACLR
jgi:threonine-phosphate decarboxylase